MQRVLQLAGGERQRPQHGQRKHHARTDPHPQPQTAFRQRAQQQRKRQGQRQRPARRARLVLRQRQKNRHQQRPAPAQQATGKQRNHRHHEQIQQAPLRQPRIGRAIRAGRAEQAIAVRQMQLAVDAFQRHLPARRGDRAAVRGQAQAGAQIELLFAQLDAAAAILALADQQRLVALRGPLQLPRRDHVEPLVMAQRAAEMIDHAEPAAVEVQPQLALHMQLIALPARVAAGHRAESQAIGVIQHIRRQLAPRRRHAGLRGVGGVAFHARAAQAAVVGVAPDLLAWPWRRRQRHGELARRSDGARVQRERPLPRPQLHAQATIAFQPRRQLAGQGSGDEAGRQHRPQQLLARAAGDVELQLRFQHRRQPVLQSPIHAQRQRIDGALGGGGLAQGQLFAVALDALHPRAIDAQRDQGDRRRHAQLGRRRVPRQRAAQLITAGRQPQHRLSCALQHDRRLLVAADLLRPVARITGQRHPAGRIHLHVELEAPAVLVGLQRQPTRPRALPAFGIRHLAGQKRTSVLRHLVQHPALPVAQRRRDVLPHQRCSKQQAQSQRCQRSTKHDVLPVGPWGGHSVGGTRQVYRGACILRRASHVSVGVCRAARASPAPPHCTETACPPARHAFLRAPRAAC